MANQPLSAEQAVSIGFFHQVFPDEIFREKVDEFTHGLVSFSKEALGLAKLAIDAAWGSDRINARNIDRMANTMLSQTEEFADSINRFTEASKTREAKRG